MTKIKQTNLKKGACLNLGALFTQDKELVSGLSAIYDMPDDASFEQLADAVGLDPKTALAGQHIEGVDFGRSNLKKYNITNTTFVKCKVENIELTAAQIKNSYWVDCTPPAANNIPARDSGTGGQPKPTGGPKPLPRDGKKPEKPSEELIKQMHALCAESISLTADEKERVYASTPNLSLTQINELISIFKEETEKFAELEKEFQADVQKQKMSKNLSEALSDDQDEKTGKAKQRAPKKLIAKMEGLCAESISLTKEEKDRVYAAVPRLSLDKINELLSIFTEEREKFSELFDEFPADVTKLVFERFGYDMDIAKDNIAKLQHGLSPKKIDAIILEQLIGEFKKKNLKKNDREMAIKSLLGHISSNKDTDGKITNLLLGYYEASGSADTALRDLLKIVENQDDIPPKLLRLMSDIQSQNFRNMDKAESHLLKALVLDDKEIWTHTRLGILYFHKMQKKKKAHHHFDLAFQLAKKTGKQTLDQKDTIDAERAIAITQANLAQCLFSVGDTNKALQLLESVATETEKVLTLEVEIYKFAHCEKYDVKKIQALLKKGVRTYNWSFATDIAAAELRGHKDLDLLKFICKMASVKTVSEEDELEMLIAESTE